MSDSVDITKTSVPLVYVVIIVGAIVGGAWAVCTTYNEQAFEVKLLRQRIETMATRDDLLKIRAEDVSHIEAHAKERVQFYLEHAALRVSTVPGKKYMRGKIEWPIKEDGDQ